MVCLSSIHIRDIVSGTGLVDRGATSRAAGFYYLADNHNPKFNVLVYYLFNFTGS